MLEFQLVVKRNLSFGSIGIEAAAGYYDNTSQDANGPIELQLSQFRLGAIFFLDTLFNAPYVVPYASAGAYIMGVNESSPDVSYVSTTTVAPYLTFGLQFSLDWIDKRSARRAYQSGGIQSTYLFAEARMYFASSNQSEGDFSNDFAPGAGLRVEF
jgi:hypothetical protein